MKTRLDHLSSEEISIIKKRYYQGESVYQILSEYGLSIAPSIFYKLLPPEEVREYGCSNCGVNLVVDAPPRSKQRQLTDPTFFYCPICKRRPLVEDRDYLSFPLLDEERIANIRRSIKQYYEKHPNPVIYDNLSLTQKIHLAVLCSALLKQDQMTIQPVCSSNAILASTTDIQRNIYLDLTKCGAIVVNPDSSLDSFDLNVKNFPEQYDYTKVSYKLNLSKPYTNRHLGEIDICFETLSYEEQAELLALWEEIAIGECVTYLLYRLHRIGFTFSPGKKTQIVFRELLANFSVAQIYYIIWCKVNDASRRYLEGNASKQHAACSVIGACQRYGENAVHYGRELPCYRRPLDCPRSVLTQFFYEKVLKLGPEADNICPHI